MNRKGFTLLELLVVIMIVGILSAVALPNYRKAIEKSRSTEAVLTSKSILDAAPNIPFYIRWDFRRWE